MLNLLGSVPFENLKESDPEIWNPCMEKGSFDKREGNTGNGNI